MTQTIKPVVTLRALRTHAEYAACVQLQRETWGQDYTDTVPASILKVSQMVGGVSAGAFTDDDELVGFVYGLTGLRDGRIMHWSHMLAVKPEYRDHGVGRRLKEYQREVLGRMGVEMIYWTFDPLVARNAHLNLTRLGAKVDEYVADMYGDTGSDLHAFGTDRFIVSWPVSNGNVEPREVPRAWRAAPVAPKGTENGADELLARLRGVPLVRIEIPADVESMPVGEARAWRAATRPSFVWLLARGYRVAGFMTEGRRRSYYVLARDAGAGERP